MVPNGDVPNQTQTSLLTGHNRTCQTTRPQPGGLLAVSNCNRQVKKESEYTLYLRKYLLENHTRQDMSILFQNIDKMHVPLRSCGSDGI